MARAAWHRLEPVNAVTYFTQECRDAHVAIGLRGFWMGYFAGRAAPMGAVAAGVVEAVFFNFHPAMVRRAIPDAWTLAAPDAVVAERAAAAEVALRRLASDADSIGDSLLPLLHRAIDHGNGAGHPLFAANRELVPALGGLAGVWQAATTLREHRGDSHVAILAEAGLDGCEAHVLFAATAGVPAEVLRDNRGWSTDEWEAATDRLRTRGVLEPSAGGPTIAGRTLRDDTERRTDELAAQPYDALSDDEAERLVESAAGLAEPIVSSGAIPFPNPMGLPRVR